MRGGFQIYRVAWVDQLCRTFPWTRQFQSKAAPKNNEGDGRTFSLSLSLSLPLSLSPIPSPSLYYFWLYIIFLNKICGLEQCHKKSPINCWCKALLDWISTSSVKMVKTFQTIKAATQVQAQCNLTLLSQWSMQPAILLYPLYLKCVEYPYYSKSIMCEWHHQCLLLMTACACHSEVKHVGACNWERNHSQL